MRSVAVTSAVLQSPSSITRVFGRYVYPQRGGVAWAGESARLGHGVRGGLQLARLLLGLLAQHLHLVVLHLDAVRLRGARRSVRDAAPPGCMLAEIQRPGGSRSEPPAGSAGRARGTLQDMVRASSPEWGPCWGGKPGACASVLCRLDTARSTYMQAGWTLTRRLGSSAHQGKPSASAARC